MDAGATTAHGWNVLDRESGVLWRDYRFGGPGATATAESGTYLHPADLLSNIPTLPPQLVFKVLMSMTDSAPGSKLFRPAVWLQVKDKKALRAWFDDEFKRSPPTTMVPAHGAPLAPPDLLEQTKALLATM